MKKSLVEESLILHGEEIDLIQLVKTIWVSRRFIYYSVGVCLFIGIVFSFVLPVKYTSSVILLPSVEEKNSNLGGLGALAGMAGINIGAMMGDPSGIPAEVYPQVVTSYPFLKEIINEKFYFEKYAEPVSIYNYFLSDSSVSIGKQIKKYTIRLPWTIKNAIFSNSKEENSQLPDFGVLNIPSEEIEAIEWSRELIQIEVDDDIGLITVSVEVGEPVLAAQYVQKVVELLQKYIIDYKTKQVKQNLDFIYERFNEKKNEYESAQRALYEYQDRNRNIVSERVDVEYQSLKDAYDIVSVVYKGLSQQLEQAKISVKEKTPVFTILEPAKVPLEKSGPKRLLIIIVSCFLGGLIGLGLIFMKQWGFLFKVFFQE